MKIALPICALCLIAAVGIAFLAAPISGQSQNQSGAVPVIPLPFRQPIDSVSIACCQQDAFNSRFCIAWRTKRSDNKEQLNLYVFQIDGNHQFRTIQCPTGIVVGDAADVSLDQLPSCN